MFSRKEREFLELVARCGPGGPVAYGALVRAFPNPAYRRKLVWGIRRKAANGAADWQLYARAAAVDSKVLPEPLPSDAPPRAADPIVSVLRELRRRIAGPRRPVGPAERDDATAGIRP